MVNNALHVNQLGYLATGPKLATLDSDAITPLNWELSRISDTSDIPQVIATGLTKPCGFDATTGRAEHVLDFSGSSADVSPGQYVIRVGSDAASVSVGNRIYDAVLLDALRVFTLQRSGFEIDPDIAGAQYARAAGHLNIAPNLGDIDITPLPFGGATDPSGVDLYAGWSGDYLVDARGGWYDAGDAGKYVVNGGISVAQLLGIVERYLRTIQPPDAPIATPTLPVIAGSTLPVVASPTLPVIAGSTRNPANNAAPTPAVISASTPDAVASPTFPVIAGSTRNPAKDAAPTLPVIAGLTRNPANNAAPTPAVISAPTPDAVASPTLPVIAGSTRNPANNAAPTPADIPAPTPVVASATPPVIAGLTRNPAKDAAPTPAVIASPTLPVIAGLTRNPAKDAAPTPVVAGATPAVVASPPLPVIAGLTRNPAKDADDTFRPLPSTLAQAAEAALSEALWELDWMLRMQVADGLPFAGMVHHKVSDEHWTSIPMLPADDPQRRFVHRPSTAATLNFAAVAAQAARILRSLPVVDAGSPVVEAARRAGLDTTSSADLAARYLAAARTAWATAVANPTLYAPDTNTLANPGSGPYNDTHLNDEFYWAAVELYLATGEPEYLTALRANPYHLATAAASPRAPEVEAAPSAGRETTASSGSKSPWIGLPDQPTVGFDWRDTAAWARLQLALNGDRSQAVAAALSVGVDATLSQAISLTELQDIRADLIANAHRLADNAAPFGQLYNPDSGKYNWGSNAMIANNAAIVAAAAELSGDESLKAAALSGLDYLFGRNALDLSYVTGYGTKYVQNQHSRWFAAAVDPSLPHPPPGTLSGGPNSDCPDAPSAHLKGQPAQFCFIDDIASYGTNEMTINWNAALAWLLAWAVVAYEG